MGVACRLLDEDSSSDSSPGSESGRLSALASLEDSKALVANEGNGIVWGISLGSNVTAASLLAE